MQDAHPDWMDDYRGQARRIRRLQLVIVALVAGGFLAFAAIAAGLVLAGGAS